MIDHYLSEGAFYPSGGGQVIAGHLVELIHAHGGRVRTHAEVSAIDTVPSGKGHRVTGVRLADGERFTAPVVVASGDIKQLFGRLLDPAVVPDETRRQVDGFRMATPLATVYLGLDFDLAERMPATNFWIHPGYDPEHQYRLALEGRFDSEPPVYVSSGSVKDPGDTRHAPPGCSTVELMTWTTADPAAWGADPDSEVKYSRQPGYRRRKRELIDRLIDRVEPVLGELRSRILWEEAATPLTHSRYTLASGGSCYGIELATDQFGPLRPPIRTPVEGLFLAGASARRGHGVVGVMAGGLDAAAAALDRDLRRELAAGTVLADRSRLTAGGPGWDPLEACRRLQDKSKRKLHPRAGQHWTGWKGDGT